MNLSRWLSLAVAIIYILLFVLSFFLRGEHEEMSTEDIVRTSIGIVFWLCLSLGCIWFGDELGEGMVGAKYGLVSSPSPGWAVELMGWILLFIPAGIFIWGFIGEGK